MENILENPQQEAPKWIRLIEAHFGDPGKGKGTISKADFDDVLGHYQSCVDVPASLFGVELAAMYPEAKVIILNRDPEDWYCSVTESILKYVRPTSRLAKLRMLFCFVFDPATRAFAKFGMAMSGLAFRYDHRTEKDKALAWYTSIYQRFRDEIPEDRRIEYQIHEGWGPLCAYLEVPIPTVRDEETGETVEAPFPRANDRETFKKKQTKSKEEAMRRARNNLLTGVGRVVLTAAVGYAGYTVWRRWL
jgi:hypothetical protein